MLPARATPAGSCAHIGPGGGGSPRARWAALHPSGTPTAVRSPLGPPKGEGPAGSRRPAVPGAGSGGGGAWPRHYDGGRGGRGTAAARRGPPRRPRCSGGAGEAPPGGSEPLPSGPYEEPPRPVSRHAAGLIQVTPAPRVAHAGWACARCGQTTNLWLNLSDGYVGCGRRNWDSSGGNDHAVEHAAATGWPLAVKLGTLTPDLGTADVYSYDRNEAGLVLDPSLREHLAHFGLDVARTAKCDPTVAEMQARLDATSFYDFGSHQFVTVGESDGASAGAAASTAGATAQAGVGLGAGRGTPAGAPASPAGALRAACAAQLLTDIPRGGGQGAVALEPPAQPVPRSLRALAAACARALEAAAGAPPVAADAGSSGPRVSLRRWLAPRRRRVPPVERTATHGCELSRDAGAGRSLADRAAMAYLASVFEAAAAGGPAAGLPAVRLSRFDLFHGHLFAFGGAAGARGGGIGMLMHAKEYPPYGAAFPFDLGFCQTGSDLPADAAGLATRNLLWLLPAARPGPAAPAARRGRRRRDLRGSGACSDSGGLGATPQACLVALVCAPGTRLARELCTALVPAPLVFEGDLGVPLGDVTYLAALTRRKPQHRVFLHV